MDSPDCAPSNPLSTISHLSVGSALFRSRATLLRAQALPGGAWLAHWRNADTAAEYLQPAHHTLSFYLEGGHAVRCAEAPAARGEPGALCCLPAGHDSRWAVHGQLQLMHLYLPRLEFAQVAQRWFDLDPRSATLADNIYFRDARLEALCARMAAADWHATGAALKLQQLALDVQSLLLADHSVHRRPLPPVRGGLGPAARRRVLELVESRLSRDDAPARPSSAATPSFPVDSPDLNLPALAAAAHLSEYHFARMFKASFGCSPHAWVMQRRLGRARELLGKGKLALDEVARRCGYAHLSHLNAALRRAGLASAARYRKP